VRRFIEMVRPWSIAVVATLAMSVSFLDRQTLAAIGPTVRQELDITHQQFGWLGSAFAFAYLVFAPPAGRLVERWGARWVLTASVLLWSGVAMLHAVAGSLFGLLVLRVALGAAEAPSFPAAATTVRAALSPAQRSAGFGLLFTGSSIGAMVAAPLAVWVARVHGFRFAFLATALVGLCWLPLWLVATRGERRPEPAAPGTEAGRSLGELLGDPAMHRQIVMVATSAPAITIVMTWFPQYLTEEGGVRKEDVGHYLWLPPLAFDVAAIAFGLLASLGDARRGHRSRHRGLMLLAGALTATLALAPLVHGPWARVALGATCMAGGAGMYVVGTADLMRRMSAIATAGGISAAVQSLVQIVASPIVGAVVDRTHAWWSVLVTLGLLAVPGALAWSFMPLEHRERAER
jgi:MFS transporter, ACS family, hexuronate transporter